MNRFNQAVRVIVGMTFLAVTRLRAAELSAEDEADVATLTKFIEAPSFAESSAAAKGLTDVLKRRNDLRLQKYNAEECLPWARLPTGCGDETTLLFVFYFASLARAEIEKKGNDFLYDAWLVVIDRYRLFCEETKKDAEAYPCIPVIEEMIRQEKAGTLKARAAAIEARLSPAKKEITALDEKN